MIIVRQEKEMKPIRIKKEEMKLKVSKTQKAQKSLQVIGINDTA